MRTRYLLAAAFMLGSILQAQTAAPTPPPQTPSGAIGPSAVWPVTVEFIKNAHTACNNAKQPPSFEECYIDQMAKAGAPPEAVKFTRDLYKANQQVGILGLVHEFGPIAMAWVVYPLRANNNDGIMFVNSKPNFLDVDNMKTLDKAPMLVDPVFVEWRKANPNLDVWPGDRAGGSAPVQYAKPYVGANPGDVRFLFSYPLIDGCHACARHGFANYWWNFDATGNFLGATFISVSPVPPPLKRARRKAVVPPGSGPTDGETPPAAPPAPGAVTPQPEAPPQATPPSPQPK